MIAALPRGVIMELLKLLSASEIVAQIISFLLLVFLLRIFVWKRLLALLDERKARIASDFKKIEDTQTELEEIKFEYKTKLASIEHEARLKMQEAIDDGERISGEIKKTAHLDAQKIIEEAKEEIRQELSRVKEEIKNQVVDLAIRAAENVIEETLSEAEDRRLVKDFLDKINDLEQT